MTAVLVPWLFLYLQFTSDIELDLSIESLTAYP